MSDLESIQSQIAKLQAQAASIKAAESAEKLADVKATVSEYGFTADQIFGGKSANRKLFDAPKSANPAPVKYRGPNGETWTGRGLTPKWLAAQIESGASKDDFLIETVAA